MIRILEDEGHPLVGELLTTLRDERLQADRRRFRGALERLGGILAYELTRDLPTRRRRTHGPLGEAVQAGFASPPVAALVLRAALPLWQGFLGMVEDAETIVLGAAREEGTLDPTTGRMRIVSGYESLVPLSGRTLVYLDPMLATGSTLATLHPRVVARAGHPERVIVATVIAYRPSLEKTAKALGADMLTVAADDGLDARGFIVPGLGDAGDLAFGPTL